MKTLRVAAGPAVYDVVVGAGALGAIPDLLPIVADRVALVHDASLPPAYLDRAASALEGAGIPVVRLPVPTGEEAKSMATAERLAGAMAAAGVHRRDLVAGLGGGATTDLSGFVAATYHRGVAHLCLPTTLLAMVDASIGGKTAVNIAEGKNLVGAFHQPEAVIADVETLATLPEPEFRSGMAEVIKHGLIGDPGLLDDLERDAAAIADADAAALESLVARAAAVKIAVVEADTTEQDVRAHLNYGHTLGHALETLGHAGAGPRWRHGEAVALGMMFVAHVARALGSEDLVERHAAALRGAGLPVRGAAVEFDAALDAMGRDKKFERGIRLVLLERLAQPRVVANVDEAVLREAYEAIR